MFRGSDWIYHIRIVNVEAVLSVWKKNRFNFQNRSMITSDDLFGLYRIVIKMRHHLIVTWRSGEDIRLLSFFFVFTIFVYCCNFFLIVSTPKQETMSCMENREKKTTVGLMYKWKIYKKKMLLKLDCKWLYI